LVYAFVGAFGAAWAWQRLSALRPKLASELAALLLAWPVLLGLTMLGGFARQLVPVQYPAEWQAAKNVLTSLPPEGKGRLLFLPWHQYLSLDFNRQLVTANPATLFFGPETVISLAPEFGSVPARSGDETYQLLHRAMESGDPEVVHASLRQAGISHVALYRPDGWPEEEQESFLQAGGFEAIYSEKSLTLYSFVLR
jgi:hypothetical protein